MRSLSWLEGHGSKKKTFLNAAAFTVILRTFSFLLSSLLFALLNIDDPTHHGRQRWFDNKQKKTTRTSL